MILNQTSNVGIMHHNWYKVQIEWFLQLIKKLKWLYINLL